MLATVNDELAAPTTSDHDVPIVQIPDPLDDDAPDDELVLTTRRALVRVALLASETGARFQREALNYDSMAWMLSPRTLFDGRAPIDACQDVEACRRGIVLHGLSLGLDAEPSFVDDLLAEDDEKRDRRHLFGLRPSPEFRRSRRKPTPRARMYTATIVDTRDNRMMQVFHASIARDVDEVRARLASRFGPDVAGLADIRQGVHVASPPVIALVPQAVLELVRGVEQNSAAPHARHFAVDIEMGIRA